MVIYNLELESADVHDECAKMADSSEEDAAVAAYFLLNLRKKKRKRRRLLWAVLGYYRGLSCTLQLASFIDLLITVGIETHLYCIHFTVQKLRM